MKTIETNKAKRKRSDKKRLRRYWALLEGDEYAKDLTSEKKDERPRITGD